MVNHQLRVEDLGRKKTTNKKTSDGRSTTALQSNVVSGGADEVNPIPSAPSRQPTLVGGFFESS
jgi:hypothetical protein